MTNLKPMQDCVLVELLQKHDKFSTREGRYDSRTEGKVVEIPKGEINAAHYKNIEFLQDKRIFFEEFKEGSRIERNGTLYSFIKIEDIRGWEDVA